ncbi:ABC transporter permease [Bifidobacterium simiarum]|uniref:ABC transporter permease n=1 Tax=Bifidobacterium simiarum TaxID=2045441 RepID=UPI001BDD17A1|nr:ABC transporter permease [Bifidobacterium simiarum]MBT1166182.1 ABC transporter permease [Bifidobacterium simiarum]
MSTSSHRRMALWKDAWRAISGNGRRFASIVVICAVGIMMLCGLNSVGRDIRGGLDDFFDRTSMHDIAIVSTLGFDDDDIAALRGVDGIDKAAGVHAQSVYTKVDGRQEAATVTALNAAGVDRPYVTEGRLPASGHEIAVTRQYLDDSGHGIGDRLTFTAESSGTGSSGAGTSTTTDMFADGSYVIVGVIIDPNDIVNPTGPLSLVSGSRTVYPMVVADDAVTGDLPYTSAVMTVSGAAAMNTYDDDYLATVSKAQSAIERMQDGQERHRTDAVRAETLRQAMWPIDEQKRKIEAMPDMLPMKAVAERRIADAEAKVRERVAGIDDAKWIIRDRSAVASYEDVKTQSEMISRLGAMFPAMFLVIALLVSLTAMARMVEEDRQLIGTYKALGYRRGETMLKYLVYSLAACLLGGVLGDILGMVGLPFVFTRRMLTRLYVLPEYPMIVDWRLAVGGVLLFVVVITGAAMATCTGSLRLAPAELMRPKAPKAGRTIVLQRVGVVWNHLSFLGKVTARNLFRYKSRALMVIVGVLGCTALMTAGFGMGSSALTLMPRQYGEIARYDVLAVTAPDDHAAAQKSLDSDDDVDSALPLQVGSVTLSSSAAQDEAKLTAQIMVVPAGESIADYIDLHTVDGRRITLDDADGSGSGQAGEQSGAQAVVTANAARKLGLAPGGKVNVTDAMADSADVRVSAVAQYYTGNVVFMTQSAYERAFAADIAPNADLIRVRGDDDARIRFADDLAEQDGYLSVMSSAKQQRDFAKSFALFLVMIGFIVVMAAILAIVVLYTLASTNISERARELATIKVLGFRRREVHGYVNKEICCSAPSASPSVCRADVRCSASC